MRCRQTLAPVMAGFTLRSFKQLSRMASLTNHQDFTDDQNLADVLSVFEEIRENNEVPDVVITVRSFSFIHLFN